MSDVKWRRLEVGEIIQPGDEVDGCNDGWRDAPQWKPATNVGEPAPDPAFPSHRIYRRRVSVNAKELREAAEWYELDGHNLAWHEMEDCEHRIRPLADWAVAELARRDAEQVERAKPITTICETIFPGLHIDVADGVPWLVVTSQFPDQAEIAIPSIRTQKQLDDLIAVLKGGAT